jgi:hypothetical protein
LGYNIWQGQKIYLFSKHPEWLWGPLSTPGAVSSGTMQPGQEAHHRTFSSGNTQESIRIPMYMHNYLVIFLQI